MKWDARLYDDQSSTRQEAGRMLISRASVLPEDRVLDIGCGTGTHTAELARLAGRGRVVGIDPSGEMLAAAGEKAAGVENISFLKQGAEDIWFKEEFTLAFSSLALQWVREQERALRNIFDSLVPGGRLAVQLPSRGFSEALNRSISVAIETLGLDEFRAGWKSPWFLPAREEYESLLEKTGFSGISVEELESRMVFSSGFEALDWALSAALLPYMARLDRRRGEYFKYAVAMNFERYRSGGGISFGFRRLVAMADKPG